MLTRTRATLAAPVALALLLMAGAARAQIVMTVTGSQTTTAGGPDATFTGSITNTGSSATYTLSYGQIDGFTLDPSAGAGDVFLSGLSFPTAPSGGSSLAPSPSPSFRYGPGSLFTVSVDKTAPRGLYTGTFGLYGYSSANSTVRELTTAGFSLSVASAPEPSGLTTASVAAAGLFLLICRRSLVRRRSCTSGQCVL